MATSLQVTMASLSPSAPSLSTRRRSVRCAAKIPMPPLNPNDPFLSRLSRVAAEDPDRLFIRPEEEEEGEDSMPYMDMFASPTLMAHPAKVGRVARDRSRRGGRRRGRRGSPPDLPSILLDGRIVYIGMPLVPAVSELIIAQLVYLAWEGSPDPVYLYINSTGTCRDDGERVALESEGFAIYDVLMAMKFPIKTLNLSIAVGHAALLLAAGAKGQRFMMPHAIATIRQPQYPSTGLRPASDVQIHAREVKINHDNLIKLLAKHTGNSEDFVFKAMERRHRMSPKMAVEFGLVDKILRNRNERIMGKLPTEKDWDKKRGRQTIVDDYDDEDENADYYHYLPSKSSS